jgi:CHASE2 domain-containing sensor protein
MAAVLGLAVAAAGLGALRVPAVGNLENRLSDASLRAARPRPLDPRILLVCIDEATLRANPLPLSSPAWADEAGAALDGAMAAGAAGVAVDLLLPEPWGHSEAFSRFVVGNAGHVALAAYSTADGTVIGPEGVSGAVTLALGPQRTASLFAFADLLQDPDGLVRRMRPVFEDTGGGQRPSFAARAAALLGETARPSPAAPQRIDYTVRVDFLEDGTARPKVSFKDLAGLVERDPERFKGKLLLLGAEQEASGDLHVNPAGTPPQISGLTLEALMVDTVLAGYPLRDAPALAVLLVTFLLAGAVAALALLLPRWRTAVLAAVAASVVAVLLALATFLVARRVAPIATAMAVPWVAAGAALLLRSRLAPYPALAEEEGPSR